MLYVAAGTIFYLGLFTPIPDGFTIPIAALLAIGALCDSTVQQNRMQLKKS